MAKKTDINITGKELFGIVFGVAIIFATLSGWIVFKLMRGYYPFQGQYQKRQKEPTTQAEDESFRFINLDRDLPEPISERSLLREWENLSVSIKNHVTDSYHRDYIGRDYHIDNSSSLAYLEPFQLEDSRSRCPALRQCIGKFILDRIQPGGNPDDTFLPSKLVSIVHSMPIKASESSPLIEAALARWRVITYFLLAPNRSQISKEYMLNSDNIKGAAEKLSADLCPFLQPTSAISEVERKESLEKTLRLGAKFGLRLFSQGAKWGFGNWDMHEAVEKKSGRRSIVVLPPLLKFTNENGHFLSGPIIVHEATSIEI